MKRISEWITTVIFLSVLFLIGLVMFIKPDKGYSEVENKYLTVRPDFSLPTVLDGSFAKQYEKYMDDQIVFKNQWVWLKTSADRLILKQDVNEVYFGKDGYYFEKQKEDLFTSIESERNLNYLLEFLDKYSYLNVRLLTVPSASVVLADRMPLFTDNESEKTYIRNIHRAVSDDVWVDTAAVLEARAGEAIYFKTDHHWTALGAYYAYEEWIGSLGLTAAGLDQFQVETVSDDFQGTIHSKINYGRVTDKINVYTPVAGNRYQIRINQSEDLKNSLYDYSALAGKDKYAFYLWGNQALVEIKSLNMEWLDNEQTAARKLLVIKDSFAHNFLPFAVNHFDETIVIDLRYINLNMETFISENEITDILILYGNVNLASDKNLYKLLK